MNKMIDVSTWQPNIDWKKVKEAGIKGALLRCGYGSDIKSQDDDTFAYNVKGCIENGIPFGVYLYSYASNTDMARSEAAHAIRLIKPYKDKISLPVYIDLEEPGLENAYLSVARAFCDKIKEAGYKPGVYTGLWVWKQKLLGNIVDISRWVAYWGNDNGSVPSDGVGFDCDLWQYTSKGSVSGIRGNVDMNISYFKNTKPSSGSGSNSGSSKPAKKTNEQLANEVIAGKWGNGKDRENRLTAAGYNYDAVQALVNKKMASTESKVYYTIQPGDTLSKIAQMYGVTVTQLVKWNNIKDANLIYAGDRIRVK